MISPGESVYTLKAEIVAEATDTTISPSCNKPIPNMQLVCTEMEADILAVTVRLVFREYALDGTGKFIQVDSSIGHGTVVDGRYLLTHNHYGLSLEESDDGRKRTVSLQHTNGDPILKEAPFSCVYCHPGSPGNAAV